MVDRRETPAEDGVIDRVIVDERREMHKLDDRGEGERIGMRASAHLAHEKEERRSEELAANGKEVVVHLRVEIEVGEDDPTDLAGNALEPFPHRLLQLGERRRSGNGRERGLGDSHRRHGSRF